MRVSMNKVTLLSAAVAALFASAAQAQVNINTGATAASYASEAAVGTTGILLTNTGPLTATATLGFAIAAPQDRFVRYDLVNGTWGTTLAGTALTLSGAAATSTVVTGGAAADTYVIFQITSAGNAQGEIVTLTPATIRATTAANVTIAYSLHETAISAANAIGVTPATSNNSARLVATGPTTLVKFTPAVVMTALPVAIETAAATTNFVKFCAGAGGLPGTAGCAATATTTDLLGLVGTIATYALVAGVLDPTTGAAVANVAVIASAGSNVVVTGDFSAAGATTTGAQHTPATIVGGAGVCTGVGTTNATTTATTATFVVGNTAYAVGSINPLCMVANNTTGIAAGSYTGTFNRIAASAAWTTGTISLGSIGQFVRDGAELQTPWFSFGGTRYISRFFFMNTGSVAANCTAVLLAETGNTVTGGSATTTGFVVPAGGQVAVLGTDVASAATVSGRAAARFTCLSPSANIQGRYVITDTVSGALDSGTMLRPGTN